MNRRIRLLFLLLASVQSCSCGGNDVVPAQDLSEEEEQRILKQLEETQQAEGRSGQF